jgi:restriction system protein
MKFRMAENSLFAVLLRSRWWISFLIAGALAAAAAAVLPADYRIVGALSGFPFAVIGAMALRRQWGRPSEAQALAAAQAVGAMGWPEFSALLQRAFEREGYAVRAAKPGGAVDFELERAGLRTLVSARRWKSARIGAEALRPLIAARDAAGAQHAVHIGVGELTEQARPLAQQPGISVWQGAELSRLRRLAGS